MHFFRVRKLTSSGFSLHFVMPVLAIVAVAGIGAVALHASHAATPTCRNFNFSTTGNNVTSGYNISKTHCVTYIQDIVNAADEQNSGSYQTMEQAYDKYYGQKNGMFGGVGSGNYNQITKVRVMAFQATYDYSDIFTKGAYKPLAINGTVSANTWSGLCGLAGGYKGKSSTWAKAAYNAYKAPDSGCTNGWGGAVKSAHHGTIGMPVTVAKKPITPPVTTPKSYPTSCTFSRAYEGSSLVTNGMTCSYGGNNYTTSLNLPGSGSGLNSSQCYAVLLGRDNVQSNLQGKLGINAGNSINIGYIVPAFKSAFPTCF